jgi:fumarylacetoacetase
MSLESTVWKDCRKRIQELLLTKDFPNVNTLLQDNMELQKAAVLPMSSISMQMPVNIGDYTDFYSSRDHASNVGIMFRGPANALQPNWLHLPVGYHGRSSSVVISETPFKRPCGQLQNGSDPAPSYGPSKEMDFELEIGIFLGGKSTALGEPVKMEDANKHIFGFCLLNDWSARDIQRWEYVPLGPFGSKNFCTSISPWIVTLEALERFRCAPSSGVQVPTPLPYLQDPDYSSFDIQLQVLLRTPALKDPFQLSLSNYKHMYWNAKQQLVHHTVTGCNIRPGDLLGSGTISGPVSIYMRPIPANIDLSNCAFFLLFIGSIKLWFLIRTSLARNETYIPTRWKHS